MNSHVTEICVPVLISWSCSTSRYLLQRRILIAGRGVGRNVGSRCTEGRSEAGCSSAERRQFSEASQKPPPALGYGGRPALAADLSVTFVLKITLLLSRRGVRDARES